MGHIRQVSGAALAVLLVSLLASCSAGDEVTSTLISGGSVVDGTGEPASLLSVRIAGNRIIAIGDLEPLPGDKIVDASGLTLVPGFIDTHSHHDSGLQKARNATEAVSQGITTIVIGQDGGSHIPLGAYFEDFKSSPAALNIASYSGHNAIRGKVMGDDFQRSATDAEITEMRSLLAADMAVGALGLSSGLEYEPGIYSETREVMALAELAAAAGGRYISHIRSEDRWLWAAIDEIIAIGRETGMPVQISHIKLAMKSEWGRAGEMIARLDAARAEGINITADIYPYEYWQSTMAVLLPSRDFRNREEISFALAETAPPEGVYLFAFLPDPSLIGKTITQIAEERGKDAVTVYSELLLEADAWRKEYGAEEGKPIESIVARSMTEGDIQTLMSWPHTVISSDGAADGHPRGRGAFPRVLGVYSRERGLFDLASAIHKMTGQSAGHMGIKDRGVIREGAYADLVLLNAEKVIDRATIENPDALSDGIARVWVNGQIVFEEGASTGARPGRIIRRAD